MVIKNQSSKLHKFVCQHKLHKLFLLKYMVQVDDIHWGDWLDYNCRNFCLEFSL